MQAGRQVERVTPMSPARVGLALHRSKGCDAGKFVQVHVAPQFPVQIPLRLEGVDAPFGAGRPMSMA